MVLFIHRVILKSTFVRLATAAIVALTLVAAVVDSNRLWPANAQPKPNPAMGLVVARRWCGQCHVLTGNQRGTTSDAVPPFAELANNPDMTRTRLYGILNNPHRMPTSALSRDDIKNIVAYIESLRKNKN